MEFLWLWAFSLKTPIGILCGLALAGCFLSFFAARSSGRGEANLTWTLNIGIIIALVWCAIYALPAPNYNVRTIVHETPVPGRVRVITRTITQRYTQDSRFDKCIENKTSPYSTTELNECMDFAKAYMEPRIITNTVVKKVPVYSGVQVKTVMYTRDARVRWCEEQTTHNLDECTAWAFKMESGPQIQVKTVHDSYQQLFDKCNSEGTIPMNDPNGSAIRNERLKICGDLALKASR
jgi:hypothetical protein